MAITGNFLRSTRGTLGARLASPNYKLDLVNESFRANARTPYFSDVVTHSRSGNATMVDSDGLIKWAPHNLALNSASPATQSITVVSGADYTVECTGVSIALSGAGTGTVTEGNPVEITASTTTLTLTVTGSEGTMWAYRSDLGGMVDNPDQPASLASYVPTTSSAVYLPRRGHHVYNGSAWVNEGLLHESEARTNLALYSNDISNTATGWTANDTITAAATGITGIDGTVGNTFKLIAGSGGTIQFRENKNTVTSGQDYAISAILKDAGDGVYASLLGLGIGSAGETPVFDLVNGTVDVAGGTSVVKEAGIYPWDDNGWYFCWARVTAGGTAGVSLGINNSATDNTSSGYVWTGDDTSGYYVAYAACEQTSGMPSLTPIPTAGATVTRAAETFLIPAANLPWPTETYGPELVTNGGPDFVDTSDWIEEPNGSVSVVSGKLRVSGTINFAGAYTTIPTVVGKVYVLDGSASLISGSGVARIYIANSPTASAFSVLLPESGEKDFFVATATTTYLRAENSVANAVFDWDFISVREVTRYPVSIQMNGRLSYADEGSAGQVTYAKWEDDTNNRITLSLDTDSTATGEVNFTQVNASTADTVTSSATEYAPGILVPFNIASRHGSTFINGAVDGVALTANTTPTALPDLSSTDLNLGYDYMGTIKTFRIWDKDLGDTGIEEATEGEPSSYLLWDSSTDSYVQRIAQ